MLVVGRREAQERTVSLRRLGSPAQEALALGEAITRLKVEADSARLASADRARLAERSNEREESLHTQTTNEFHSHP